MMQRLSRRHVVLLGVGHTNAHVLRMWRMNALPDTDLTCISNHSIATYSGMLPAVLAGQVPPESMELDLVPLCVYSGAKLVTGEVTGIELAKRELQFGSRPPIPFDALSIGVGSVPSFEDVTVEGDSLVQIKPMQTFLDRLRVSIANADARLAPEKPLHVVVVGSGVAGMEISFCIPGFLKEATKRDVSLRIVTRSERVVPDLEPRTRQLLLDELERRGVEVLTKSAVKHLTQTQMELQDGSKIEADIVLWATGASPPPLLAKLGLQTDKRGFLATDNTLQVLGTRGVFAVGDTGTIEDENLPKAGVYAVRQGPVLWRNLAAHLDGRSLAEYRPQRSFMKLVNLGKRSAVGQWRGTSFRGNWVLGLKDRIDQRFMDKFRVEPGMPMGDDPSPADPELSEQCRGCGCKLQPDALASVLGDGGNRVYEDAAEIGGNAEQTMVASTDFFSSPFDDAYLSGRVAALHSASDVIATGGSPSSALSNVVLPPGDSASQRRALADLLAGAREEFGAMGAEVVGGHTIVGPRMELGFTVIGSVQRANPIRKDAVRPNDRFYLTKPLGIGVLLAAHMRCQCSGADYDALIATMLQRQHSWAKIAIENAIIAGTDITGFGFAGHLLEMLDSSRVSATISLSSLPALSGAIEAFEEGIESSLAPANRIAEASVLAESACRDRPAYQLLFDPQTCGGLLYCVPPEQEQAFLADATSAGLDRPSLIGVADSDFDSKAALRVEP